jgi:DnaJ-class molecular chaperone
MAQTVNKCLTIATDSVTVINDINTNGQRSQYVGYDSSLPTFIQEQTELTSQAEVNSYVQVNVNHLKTILAYAPKCNFCDSTGEINAETCEVCSGTGVDPNDNTLDIVGYSGDKSSYTSAITTGEAYIAANR